MWGLAAALGPVGWVVAAVGTAATAYALMDDGDEYEVHSNKSEKEAEARAEARTEKRNKIKQEIEAYKNQQIKRLKDKYDVDVEFISDKESTVTPVAQMFGLPNVIQEDTISIIGEKPNNIENIKIIEKKNKEIMYLIKNFQKVKDNETTC